jgi:hypothetical protein
MNRRVSQALRLALVSAVSVVSLAGCSGERESCPGVSIGNRYELLVGTVPSAEPVEQKCVDDWGFVAGTVFEAEIVRAGAGDGNGCRSGIPTMSGNGGWLLDMNSRQFVAGGGLLEGQYAISNDTCVGSASLAVLCKDSCQYSAEPCACLLSLNLSPTENGCPSVCIVTTAATVSKL